MQEFRSEMNFHSSDGLAADRSFTVGAVFGTMLIGLGGFCWWVATHGVTSGPTVEAPLMYAAAPPSSAPMASGPGRPAEVVGDSGRQDEPARGRSIDPRSPADRPPGAGGFSGREAYGAMGPDAPTMAGTRWAPADARPSSVRSRRPASAGKTTVTPGRAETAAPAVRSHRRASARRATASPGRAEAAAPAVRPRRPITDSAAAHGATVRPRRPASARAAVPAPGAPGSEAGIAELRFRFGSADVDLARAEAMLAPLVETVIARGCQQVLVDGHADPTGPQQHNLILAWQRAEATRDWLTERGIAADRIVVRSFGAFQPKLSANLDRRAQRRVEVRATGCAAREGAE